MIGAAFHAVHAASLKVFVAVGVLATVAGLYAARRCIWVSEYDAIIAAVAEHDVRTYGRGRGVFVPRLGCSCLVNQIGWSISDADADSDRCPAHVLVTAVMSHCDASGICVPRSDSNVLVETIGDADWVSVRMDKNACHRTFMGREVDDVRDFIVRRGERTSWYVVAVREGSSRH